MKKFFTLLAVVMLAATSLQAKAKQEIGGIVGGLDGISYKYWLGDKLALQADLAVGMTAAPVSVPGWGTYTVGFWDFTLNPNALYHFDLPENFKVYTGGGVNLGMLGGFGSSGIEGKFGINAVGGVAFHFDDVPLVLAFDFRPGYGMAFSNQADMHYFDWKLAFAVRYAF